MKYKILAAALVAALASTANAQGFREQRAWQFDDPVTKAAKIQRETLRKLGKGGYFEGSHANKSIYIGEVYVEDVSGSMMLQDSSNIGNQTVIQQNGDGTLEYSGEQTTGDQDSSNTIDDAAVVGGATNGGDQLLNVGGGS